MKKRNNPVMIENRDVMVGDKRYTRRTWANGFVQHYRVNKRQACLVRLDAEAHAKLIAKIDAALAV